MGKPSRHRVLTDSKRMSVYVFRANENSQNNPHEESRSQNRISSRSTLWNPMKNVQIVQKNQRSSRRRGVNSVTTENIKLGEMADEKKSKTNDGPSPKSREIPRFNDCGNEKKTWEFFFLFSKWVNIEILKKSHVVPAFVTNRFERLMYREKTRLDLVLAF